MLFQNWTDSEIEDAIRALEESLALGVRKVDFPSGESVEYSTPRVMRDTVASMRAELDRRAGRKHRRARQVRVNYRSGL